MNTNTAESTPRVIDNEERIYVQALVALATGIIIIILLHKLQHATTIPGLLTFVSTVTVVVTIVVEVSAKLQLKIASGVAAKEQYEVLSKILIMHSHEQGFVTM